MQSDMQTLINEQFPNHLLKADVNGSSVVFHSHNGVMLWVEAITNHVMRFRYSAKGYFSPDFSYAMAKDHRSGFAYFKVEELDSYYELRTPKLSCRVQKIDLKVSLYNEEGKLLNEDEKGFHWEEDSQRGDNIVKMSKRSINGEHYFGLGDKPSNLNLRDHRFQNWGTDEYGFAKDADPLYRNIPFYYGLHKEGCYGVFFDNSYRTFFDFASERKNVTSFWAEGGEINYYFIAGSSLMNIAQRYARLTGKPEMPPKWSLGYHQCKWSYSSEEEVMEIAHKLRELKIPADAIYLDIDYMDGFRCFTWNKENFPDPKGMVQRLKDMGFKTVAIIDPGIKIDMDYSVCKEGFEKNYFCKHADGPLYKGKVWPGDCYFPDFTNPEVREWWSGLFKELIEDIGLAGVWNDMNEPAIMDVPTKTFPLDIRHNYDGNYCSHRKAHNVYGMQMSRATYKGVKKFAFPNRPFIITRSTYAGGQRYSSVWTGDNIATWEHLWVANVQCQRLSISGFSFVGTDIGGFTEHPTMELYVRWMQLAVFHPLMRTHSSGDHGDQEPWSFGEEGTDLVRKAIELRYQLLPYHYTNFYQYSRDGKPMIRPLSFYDHQDPQTWYRQDEFVFGDHILVCPVLEPDRQGRRMYLPKGHWYDFHTKELVEGGKEIYIETSLEEIPMMVKAGAIIPMIPVEQHVSNSYSELELHVYRGEESVESLLYDDAGDGYNHNQGYFLNRNFTVLPSDAKYRITQHQEGRMPSSVKEVTLVYHGFKSLPKVVELDSDPFEVTIQEEKNGSFSFKVAEDFKQITLRWG
ncbi:glycoside hydrolase family 31 protein [Croceimicrobium hydrocarbonivorans]|uniref:Glycoside hydrolase family 31 protein n=2 Tax=Croceimicrobium hydrocarbonivorans TaxID=2761580 RepID=A0A7H0VK22_9FLAO|nr:glycoside hydrolase family 31 protein [Croceimicrobium hydrocarbonivorans]